MWTKSRGLVIGAETGKYGYKGPSCNLCKGVYNLKRCGKCKTVYYCHVKCQGEDWKNHKPKCDKNITSE